MPHRRTTPKTFSQSHALRHDPTQAEYKLWQFLRAHRFQAIHFRNQHAIGPYIVDFCAPREKLVIELDGGQHLDNQEYDDERSSFLIAKGYRVLRFWNNEVIHNIDGVLNAILDSLEAENNPPQSPHFPKAENGGR